MSLLRSGRWCQAVSTRLSVCRAPMEVPRAMTDKSRRKDCSSFHEPQGWLHYVRRGIPNRASDRAHSFLPVQIEKKLMLETDSAEVPNQCIKSVRKMGSVGLISAYAGYCNHFNSMSCYSLVRNQRLTPLAPCSRLGDGEGHPIHRERTGSGSQVL